MKSKVSITVIAIAAVFLFAWQTGSRKKDFEKEVHDAEKAFEKMASEKGIAEAFYFYADENAVIKRQNDTLIKGRDNIRNYYAGQNLKNATVNWTPDFISVSENGDLAYTYGKYIWTNKNDKGELKTATGVFHTVWKRQKDGSWKYVWD
jgi:ketosteroid isomerase-like protein